MRCLLPLVLLSLLLGAGNSQARVWFVYPDGSGQAPTIQAGIDSSAAGDTIVAMPGIFSGDGNWDIDFKGKGIAVLAAASFDPAITDTTIIDGYNISSHWAFIFHSNEDSASVVSGFKIQNMWPTGIRCDHSSPTISNNDISGYHCCIECNNASPRIIENLLQNLRAKLICSGGSPFVKNNICIGGNDCVSWDMCPEWLLGGCASLRIVGNSVRGIYISNCTGTIDSNAIYGGFLTAPSLEIIGSTLTITNNWIGWSDDPAIRCEGSAVIIANNQINSYVDMLESLPSRVINNNIMGGEGFRIAGIRYNGDSTTVIEGNAIHDFLDGPGIEVHSSIRIADNVIYYNGFGINWMAGGIQCEASPIIEGNTIVGNIGVQGAGIHCAPGSSAILRNNIIAFNNSTSPSDYHPGEGIHSESTSIRVECCDVFGNDGGNYVGIPDQTGLNGNISVDPIFCDAAHHDYSIHELSPCAPGMLLSGADCGLIGALGVGCSYVETLVQSYRVFVESSAVVVVWELARGAASDRQFIVYRCESPSSECTPVAEADIVHSGTSYSFRDTHWESGATYRYRVEVVEASGRRVLFETDAISIPAMSLTLYQNHPNPFNPSTTIEYYLPENARVKLEVYDSAGRRIATLVDGEQEKGARRVVWNGIDDRGNAVASGVYFSRLAAGRETISKKIIVLK